MRAQKATLKERQTMLNRTVLAVAFSAAFFIIGARNAEALTSITGTVGTDGKYLVTGSTINVAVNTVLKISFGATTSGDNVELCAGTGADFVAGACPTRLSDSGGVGFVFLTIVDASSLNGKQIYVIRAVGTTAVSFRLTIE
jgi:hypothetical protein